LIDHLPILAHAEGVIIEIHRIGLSIVANEVIDKCFTSKSKRSFYKNHY